MQGVHAAAEIVKGINYFSKTNHIDLLIIGRGGGSLEDLWPFNEESVVRAMFDCPIPIISGVGHEVDFSISDFVADVRAATPTHAAVLATPDINEVRMLIEDLTQKLQQTTIGGIEYYKDRVQHLSKSHALLAVKQKMKLASNDVNFLRSRLKQASDIYFTHQKHLIHSLIQNLASKNPNLPLEQGYARIWQKKDWIRTKNKFNHKEVFTIEWLDGKSNIK